MATTVTKRIGAAASGGQTARVSTSALSSSGQTARVSTAALSSGGQTARMSAIFYLALEGDESGHVLLDGDMQSGTDVLTIDGIVANATKRVGSLA
jgi:hypothetical protein